VSAQELEQAGFLVGQAQGELVAAQAMHTKAQALYERNDALAQAKLNSARAEADRAVRQLPVESLELNLTIAKRRLADAVIKAPIAGQVLKVFSHPGDTLGTQPILHLADTTRLIAVAEVYETNVATLDAWLAKGPVQAELASPALPGGRPDKDGRARPLHGVLNGRQHVSRMIARNALFALSPREDADRRVVEVDVDLDAESVKASEDFIGLQVRVTFLPPP
jgi:HlyD family secretion protein